MSSISLDSDMVVDGVSPDPAAARRTLARIRQLASERPTVYLPSHDPEAVTRLTLRQGVGASPAREAA